jgi:glycosyltransferase involved in cell wall biosynthesis
MRVAFLAPAHPIRGGIVQFVAVLARKLIDAGHDVKVFSFDRQYPALLFPGKNQLEPGSDPVPVPSETVVTPYQPLTWPSAAKQIADWQPDLLLMKYWIPFFAPCFGWIARRVKAKSHCRVAYIIDNIDFHEKWLMAKVLTRYALNPARDLIVMSNSVETMAKAMFPRHSVHYREHPDYDFFTLSPGTRQDARKKFGLGNHSTLLFFGYIKRYKGLDLLLEALPLALRSLPDLRLLIAGEVYGDDSVYTGLIAQYKLEKSIVSHMRFIANDEVASFFRAADVAVLPYRTATQSGVTKAAFAFDLPVIATDVGGLGEVIQPGVNGYLVKPDDPEALAAAIVRFFREDRGEAFREAIRSHRKTDTWQPFVETIAMIGERK